MSVIAFTPTTKEAAHLDPITAVLPPIDGEDIALVASYGSLVMAKRRGFRRIVLAQHGAGQSYGGDPRTARNPGYPGGDRNEAVGLFLCPNEYSADRWRQRYPDATVRVVGCPRLDTLPRREPGPGPVVALSWHWNAYFSPEANSAFPEYAAVLPALARRFHVIGTGHPQRRDLRWRYESMGIEYVGAFEEIARRADVLVADNTSALFEFAASRPVVVVNSPTYRRTVHHGGRFWTWSAIGPNVDDPADLADAIEVALSGWPERELVLERVYQPRTGGAKLAADAIVQWSLDTAA